MESDEKINIETVTKDEKIDLNMLKKEQEKENFFEYTNRLLADKYIMLECKKYLKLKEKEKKN